MACEVWVPESGEYRPVVPFVHCEFVRFESEVIDCDYYTGGNKREIRQRLGQGLRWKEVRDQETYAWRNAKSEDIRFEKEKQSGHEEEGGGEEANRLVLCHAYAFGWGRGAWTTPRPRPSLR